MFNRYRNLGKYAGYQYSVVSALPASAGSDSFFAGASPAVANGNFAAAQLLTSPDNYAWTLDGDGVPVVYASGSTAQQHMTLDVYNTPLRSWYGPVTSYINNHTPTVNYTGSPAISLPVNTAISHIDYNPFAFDSDNGDTVTVTTASTLPTGLTLVNGVLQGTPTAVGTYPVTYTATDELGATAPFPVITYTIFGTVTSPNVVGNDSATAEAAITAAGLLFTTASVFSALPVGTCVSQVPPAGTSMNLGDTVALSLASSSTTAPNVVGDTEAAAISAINTALLTPQVGTATYSDTVALGLVISQSPVAGASVSAGQTITYVLSLGPQPVVPPPIISTTLNVGRVIFGPIFNGEAVVNIFDFSSSLATGESITNAAVTATVYSGVDPNPSAIIIGNSSVSGPKVSQIIEGGVIGTIYAIECTVNTSLSQTLTLSAYYAVETNLP